MAESTGSKNNKTLDAFADDLDAMLNIGDSPNQQVGEIDDDEVIDRLLVGDDAFEPNGQLEIDEFADIDSLLDDDDLRAKPTLPAEIDEFADDFDDDIKINPSQELLVNDDEFADVVDIGKEQDVMSMDGAAVLDEVAELEQVGEIDEFAIDEPAAVVESSTTARDDLENMTEIDEFSDDGELVGNTADFLIADFDISADEDFAPKRVEAIDDFVDQDIMPLEEAVIDEEPQPEAASESVPAYQPDTTAIEAKDVEPELEVVPAEVPPAPIPVQVIDHSDDIATLNRQIVDLKKHQQQIRHDLTELADKGDLMACVESMEKLETEQKKTKRAVDALAAKKPVSAYVANGVAAVALLVGTGLGIQGMIAKSQVGELVTIIGKLQEQVNAAPNNDAADKEMLRKQLDELSVSSGVMATQIAELNKALHSSEASVDKTGGDSAKAAPDVANQIMQIGASIETLQNKVSALEKGRAVAAAPAPKPEKKKPEPIVENWAVNLIAFKQDWYAKSKAQEFAGKGVPAKVIKTESKGEDWYRLYVDGFNSQYEAAAYAARIKKTLNLDSVWVTRNKE